MKKQDIPKIANNLLSDHLSKSGGILYSSHETLKPGPVYLMGFNPGGSGGAPLADSLESMLSYSGNAYIDECWNNANGSWNAGEAPLQKRIRWLLAKLGLDVTDVCASNLIFFRSQSAQDINFSLADDCWPVHEAILEVVQPRMILTFGNSDASPYGYLFSRFGGTQETLPSGHGNWKVKGFTCSINGRSTYVAGLPHLSRYSPIEKNEVVSWLKARLKDKSK